jgi:hypothetical protein
VFGPIRRFFNFNGGGSLSSSSSFTVLLFDVANVSGRFF